MTDLAITARCEGELTEQFRPDEAAHVLATFQQRRGQNPESGETMAGVGGPIHKLHADLPGGRSIRAVTWYDRAADICWLCGGGWHDDVYDRMEELYRRGELLPTETDRANASADAAIRIYERMIQQSRPGLLTALERPGEEVQALAAAPHAIPPTPAVFFLVQDDQLQVRVVFIDRGQRTVSARQLAAIAAGVFGADAPPPEGGEKWDSIYLRGPLPDLDGWPPVVPLGAW